MKIKKTFLLISLCFLSALTSAQSLDSLLQEAYAHNPTLKSLQLEYEAALQKGPQVSQLPDPTIGVAAPILRPETRLGAQVLNVSASQLFPWFGTLGAKEDIILTMAKTKYEKIALAKLDLDYQIKTAYYNLVLLNAKQAIIKKNIRIYETLENVSLSKVESGKSIASDVLNVRIQLEQLKQDVRILEAEKITHTALINEATYNSIRDSISIDIVQLQLIPLNYDVAAYRTTLESFHPLIKQLDWKIETSKKELALNTLAGKPTLGVGLEYSLVQARTDAFPVHNGQDILIPKVMMSLPIHRKKYSARHQEELLKQQSFDLQKESLTNKMLSRLASYKSDYERALLLHDLYKKQMVLSESAYQILLSEYSGKGNRFDELMTLQNNAIQYETEIIQAIVQSHMAKFNIERLTDF